jgi:hypothetical protein
MRIVPHPRIRRWRREMKLVADVAGVVISKKTKI